jgi:hypothetical protein
LTDEVVAGALLGCESEQRYKSQQAILPALIAQRPKQTP